MQHVAYNEAWGSCGILRKMEVQKYVLPLWASEVGFRRASLRGDWSTGLF